jgi:hypothetical protein
MPHFAGEKLARCPQWNCAVFLGISSAGDRPGGAERHQIGVVDAVDREVGQRPQQVVAHPAQFDRPGRDPQAEQGQRRGGRCHRLMIPSRG